MNISTKKPYIIVRMWMLSVPAVKFEDRQKDRFPCLFGNHLMISIKNQRGEAR